MNPHKLHAPFRWVSRLVLLLILVAMVYVGYMSIRYWSGIAV